MKGTTEPESEKDTINHAERRPRRSAAITAADRLAAAAKAESAGQSKRVRGKKCHSEARRGSDASDSLDSDFASSAADVTESDEVSCLDTSEADEHEGAAVSKPAAWRRNPKRPSDSSGSKKLAALNEPGQQQRAKRQRRTPLQLMSGSDKGEPKTPSQGQLPAAAAGAGAGAAVAAAGALATDIPGNGEDWDLQLALQMSLQENFNQQAGTGDVELPGVNSNGNEAVNDNHQQQQQQQQQAASWQQHPDHQTAAVTCGTERHDCSTTSRKSNSTSELQGSGRSGSDGKGRKGGKKKAAAAAALSWTAADLFDLFAMFEPAGGVVTKQDIVKQMLKAGMEADNELVDNMMHYAKQLIQQQAQLLGNAVANSSSNSLEYEEFVLLGQYIDAPR